VFADLIFQSVMQADLDREKKRLESHAAAEKALQEARKQQGLLNMSDYLTWVDGSAERETEKQRPAAKESSDVDVPKPSGSRFPPPPRRS
jgi:hypothetical protein